MKKVTIYDVAREAGVAPATVSRAANQSGYVSAATRAKIEKAMHKLGYVPPAQGDAAPTPPYSSTKVIGVLVPDIRYEHCSNLVFHIEMELSRYGYNCILCNANNSHEKALRDMSILIHRKVEGLILVNSFFAEPPIAKWLQKYSSKLPVVMLHGGLDLPNVYCILPDIRDCNQHLVEQMLQKGKRHFAFIQSRSERGSLWIQRSLANVLQAHGLPPLACLTIDAPTVEAGYRAAGQLFAESPFLNVFIFDHSFPAIGACRFFQDSGIAIPQEVCISTADMLSCGELVSPKLSCTNTHQELMGHEAARTITDLLNGLDRPHRMLISVEPLPRETT